MEIGSGQGAAKPAKGHMFVLCVFYAKCVCACVFGARKGRTVVVICHYGN